MAIAGVQGNGQEELAEALLGLRSVDRGTITLHGNQLVGRETHGMLRDGVGFVPEDRQHNGLVGQLSVAENLVLDLYDRDEFSPGAALAAGSHPGQRRSPHRRVRRADSPRPAFPPGRYRAAISRRSCWPARCRATQPAGRVAADPRR